MADSNNPFAICGFTTHEGEVVTGQRLKAALNKVANDWATLARDIRDEDDYAEHVSERTKDEDMLAMLEKADRIRKGEVNNFAIWQRVNTVLTGKCVDLMYMPAIPVIEE